MSDMSFASLSPSLLARKGGAKPAMRRQSIAVAGAQAHQPGAHDAALEDLGWNDLGDTEEPVQSATPASSQTDDDGIETVITADPAHENDDDKPDEDRDDDFAPLARHARSTANPALPKAREGSPDLTSRAKAGAQNPDERSIAMRIAEAEAMTNAIPQARPKGKRTAFTLRLDAERHLKLRLACTLAGRSAQSLVTEALDTMIADMPELEALYARVQSRTHQEG